MNRLVLLDSGPLGLVTNPRESSGARRCKEWLKALLAAGARVAVPEIADYEVRRELLRAGRAEGVRRLDELAEDLDYLPIDTAVWRKAAALWAQARNAGKPTADAKALDGDVILAAQAILASADGWDVTIATTNVGHLGRIPEVDAREWASVV